jgi:hypothetical protein
MWVWPRRLAGYGKHENLDYTSSTRVFLLLWNHEDPGEQGENLEAKVSTACAYQSAQCDNDMILILCHNTLPLVCYSPNSYAESSDMSEVAGRCAIPRLSSARANDNPVFYAICTVSRCS